MSEKNGKYQPYVDHCFDLFKEFSNSEYRQEKIANIKEAYRVYHQIEKSENKFWEGESKLVLPLLSITVDNIEPRLVAGLIGKQPVVEFEMDGANEQDKETAIIQEWFNDELWHTVGIRKVASTVIHKTQLEGTAYPICEYDEDDEIRRKFQFEQVPVIDPQTGQVAMGPGGEPILQSNGKVLIENGEPQTIDEIESIFRGGRVNYADFGDVYTADNASNWELSDVIRIVRPTYGELVNKKDKKGYLTEKINKDLLGSTVDELSDEDMPVIGDIKVLGKKVVECLECSVRLIDKGDKEDSEVDDWTEERYVCLITKETKTLIRIIKLIELNFKNQHLIKRVRLFSEEGKAYGTSMYEKLKAIQNGATDLYNQVINVATICMIPWFLYTDTSGMDAVQDLKPGVGIKVDDPSQVNFPRFNQNPRSYIAFIEMFLSLWEKVGSISDLQIGRISQGSSDVTATETMAAIQEGNIKNNYQSISLKEDFVEVIKTLYDMYYQKMPFEAVTIHHGEPVQIPREAMQRRYKFKIVGSTDLSNKVLDMQRAESQYKTLRQDPLANGAKLLTDLVSALNEDAKPEEYINPTISQLLQAVEQNPEIMQTIIPQYLQQKQQQQAQAEQAQQQQQAVNAGTAAGRAIVEGQNA